MHRNHAFLSILIASLLLVAPGSGAQTSSDDSPPSDPRFQEDGAACRAHLPEGSATACIVQYAHIHDILNRAPLTVHRPHDQTKDLARGHVAIIGHEGLWDLNGLVLTPSVGHTDQPGPQDPEIHPSFGLATNLTLDPDVPIFGYWYMSASLADLSDAGGPAISAYPCLTVRMTVETGRFVGQGEVVTQGQVTKTLLNMLEGTDHTCTGDREATVSDERVTEFAIEMPPIQDPILAETGFLVHVEWWNHAPGDPDEQDKIYLPSWRIHTGPEYAPRIVLPVDRPFQGEIGRVKADDGRTYVEGIFRSPFGAADLDPGSVRLQVFDQAGNEMEVTTQEPQLVYSRHHDSYLEPVRASIVWHHGADGLAPGGHTLEMVATNWQGSSGASARFDASFPDIAESPWTGTGILALALLGLVCAARRRRAPGRRV